MKNEKTKKGPKGICFPKEARPATISMIPTAAPVKKAIKSQINASGQPKNVPAKSASFTSPRPIPRPLVTRWIRRRIAETKNPAKTLAKKEAKKIAAANTNKKPKRDNSSGINFCSKSITKIVIITEATNNKKGSVSSFRDTFQLQSVCASSPEQLFRRK